MAGTFNIYVFPEWISRVAPFRTGEMHVQADLSRPGFRISSPHANFNWTIRPDKIVLESESPTEDCGHIIDKVFETLPWTPFTALGNNFVYEAPSTEVDQVNRESPDFAADHVPSDYEFVQRGWHIALKREGRVCGLQLIVKPEVLQASTNFHVDLTDQGIDRAREAAALFETDRQDSARLLEHFLGIPVEDGHVHI